MLSTTVVFALVIGLIPLFVFVWMAFLRLGLAWAKVQNVTKRRLVTATASIITFQVALNLLSHFLAAASQSQAMLIPILETAAAILAPCLIISRVFQATLLRSFQAWLVTLLPGVAMVGFSLLVLRPFIYEAFYLPTNAMAPTLLGRHWQGVCPLCGEPNFCTPDPRKGDSTPRQMICQKFHVTETARKDFPANSGDRILVAKFLAPRRWDLVAFQFPGNPHELYVKRLVGLPGETIHIEDGAVWVNGETLTPPDSIKGIEYLSEIPSFYRDLAGTKENPAFLGDDEYFVLGDFSAQSSDSRFWEDGAPGHHRYAVPRSHFVGVVTHIYWPPKRWRTLR